MAKVEGHFEARFSQLRDILAEQIASEKELGSSIVVNVDGKTVVDIWGGYSDTGKKIPWAYDTITNVWSCTKIVASLAVLIQIDRGRLDLDEPVATYWPEFAANGKSSVTVRHLLSHTAGLSAWEVIDSVRDVCNLNLAVDRLAQQALWWEPGSASGYHLLTYGHLLSELVRRTSGGKRMKQFVVDDIAGALPDTDFQIGALKKDYPRISPVVPPPPTHILDFSKLGPESIPYKTFHRPQINPAWAVEDWWRQAELPALNGHGNARSLARMLSAITLGGEVDGVKLLSPTTIDRIFDVQADGIDLVLRIPITFGVGFALYGEGTHRSFNWIPKGRVCFWGGWGGSVVICDLDRRITLSYVMNKMGAGSVIGNERTPLYVKEIYKALDLESAIETPTGSI
jgi:CubicO group peptidase (beta-lactamase class C family)